MFITLVEFMVSYKKKYQRLWTFETLSNSFYDTEIENVYLI